MSELNLKLPDPPPHSPKAPSSILWKSFISVGVITAAVGAWWPQPTATPSPQLVLDSDHEQTVPFREDWLIRLKKSGAWKEAAQMFRGPLSAEDLEPKRRAELLVEQAECFHGAGQHGRALLNLYSAEELSADQELDRKIQRALLDNLRAMGRFDALGDELARKNAQRQDQDSDIKDPVVATVNGEPLKLSAFRKQVDLEIKTQVAQKKAEGMSAKELEHIEQALEKQYGVPGEQFRLLQQWISQQVLLREAEQWKLEQHPDVAPSMERFRKQLLTSLLLETQLKLEPIGEAELENYIKANPKAVGLDPTASPWTPDQLAAVKSQASEQLSEQKRKDKEQAFQKELMQRHQVEVFREAFTEGAQ